jgi:hypothetical protein
MFVQRYTRAIRAATFLMSFFLAYFGLAAGLPHDNMHSSGGLRSGPVAALDADNTLVPSESALSAADSPGTSDCPVCSFQAQLVSPALMVETGEFPAVLDPVPSPVTAIARILKIDIIALQNSRAPPVG